MKIRFKRDTQFRKQFFVPDSFAHPAKLDAQLLIWIVERYTQEGETILDPMAGSGTLMLACGLGRNVVMVELEEKFCKMMRDNWEVVKQNPQLGSTMGTCQIIQGDAMGLSGLLADTIISSPPYEGSLSRDRSAEDWWNEEREKKHSGGSAKIAKGYQADAIVTSPPYADTPIGFGQGMTERFGNHPERTLNEQRRVGYSSESKSNISNLPYGSIDKIVTSPPYTNRMDGGLRGSRAGMTPYTDESPDSWYTQRDQQNIGNLKYGEIDAVITSPPYEGALTSTSQHGNTGIAADNPKLANTGRYTAENKDNIGNLKSDNYLSAMLQVYQQCHSVLKPQGLMILIVKNFIRNKQIVRLDTDTIKLCEQAGFKFLERHYRELPAQSFWRVIYKQKYPDVPEIKDEDILVFEKEVK